KARRACERAMVALRLLPVLKADLEREGTLRLYREVELPLVRVLADMEVTGVRVDVDALREAEVEMNGKLAELESEIYALAGEEFNIGSPSKVGEILFDRMGLDPKAKKTKTGQYSTSEDVLEKVAHKSPIVGKILEYRQLKKLITTYLTALPASINPATGRIHTNYNQTVTATGRISSSAPNLQNIPVRDSVGREIRRAFIPSEGNLFLSADYSQIELRLVADFADEEAMIEAFAHDRDIHAITAAKIAHKSPEEVTADERRKAKTANFGILYGITAFGLASRLGIPRSEAKELIDGYFESFPKIRKYMADSVEDAREHGYVSTRMGRRRYLPDINSKNPVVRGYAERNAINAPVQGTAADIIKVAMIRIYDRLQREGFRSKMIMQVHDELNFDVVPEELPRLQEMVLHEMEGAWSGRVPLTASSGAASNWLDAH
ncbi:MAG: DNA polymerase I, partial [Muribaculaceae bacterium]|nr:DNA polymerase I [Muribaculaceae bacterium]